VHALRRALEHTSQIADSARTLFTQQLPPDYFTNYPELIAHIPTADVAREASHLDPQHSIIVLVGDRAQIEASLSKRGFTLESCDPKLLE